MMIGLIDHGLSNLDSVDRALQLCGTKVLRVTNSSQLSEVDKLILPGVGSFDTAMSALNRLDLTKAIQDFALQNQKPLLGICLGMQLLLSKSEEGQAIDGLNLIPGIVEKIPTTKNERVPHVGWNQIELVRQSDLLNYEMNERDFYFVHSYRAVVDNAEHIIAITPYADGIQSVIGHGRIFGTQFHPEKSHKYGLEILKKFVEEV
jgi:glutamine amidotransferase